MKTTIFAVAMGLMAAPALADGHITGDAAAGENAFKRQCVSCHVVKDDAGNTLAGRSARTGPNLFDLAGGVPGSVEGFNYSASLASVGETGVVWDEATFTAYVMDPTTWLRDTLEDPRGRSRMSFRVRNPEDAINLYAYLAQFSAE